MTHNENNNQSSKSDSELTEVLALGEKIQQQYPNQTLRAKYYNMPDEKCTSWYY